MAFTFQTDLVKEDQPELIQHLLETVAAWVKQPTLVYYNGVDVVKVETLEQFNIALVNDITQFIKANPNSKHLMIGIEPLRSIAGLVYLLVYRASRLGLKKQELFKVTLIPDAA